MDSYYKNIKMELTDCPHTFSADLTVDLSSSKYVNEQRLFFSEVSSSNWWAFYAEVVSNWF